MILFFFTLGVSSFLHETCGVQHCTSLVEATLYDLKCVFYSELILSLLDHYSTRASRSVSQQHTASVLLLSKNVFETIYIIFKKAFYNIFFAQIALFNIEAVIKTVSS